MPDNRVSAAKRAFDYAEKQLGVNQVYEDALSHRAELDTILTELSSKKDNKRDLEMRIADREMEIASDEWGKHPEMSAARMKDHFKTACNKDDSLRELHEELAKTVGEVEGLEYDREMAKTDITIAASRLQELGGYLQYLAAVKQATFASNANKAKETTS